MSGAPRTQRVVSADEIGRIDFDAEGLAAVMVPAKLLPAIAFKNDRREPSPRLEAVERSIRLRGYDPTEPIVARVGQKGKWVVVDGGHRLTAVRRILGCWWRRVTSRPIGDLYFLLFLTPRSFAKRGPRGPYAPPPSALPAASSAALR
jgi:hypothetical protein